MHQRERSPMAPSRRGLAGMLVAAVAVPAVLPLPAYAAAAEAETSAEVSELTRLYDAAMRRTAAAYAMCEAADERYAYPAVPEALFARHDEPLLMYVSPRRGPGGRYWYGEPEKIDQLRGWPMDKPGWEPQRERRAEILTAYDRWQAEITTAKDAAGVTVAEAEHSAAVKEDEKPIRTRILALRSAEPAALRLKVQAYLSSASAVDWRAGLDQAIDDATAREGGPWEDAMAASILRDIVLAYALIEA